MGQMLMHVARVTEVSNHDILTLLQNIAAFLMLEIVLPERYQNAILNHGESVGAVAGRSRR
jgi:hypothetical protein